MKQIKLALGCLTMLILTACAPHVPAASQASSATANAPSTMPPAPAATATAEPTSPPVATLAPTRDLTSTSVEFELEITGDPHPLSAARGVVVDQQGNLYVMDCGSNRVQKFDSEGSFITTWGREGTGDGEFKLWVDPEHAEGDVAIDAEGRVYVVDSASSRIQVFDSEGQFLFKWGEFGMGDGQLYCHTGIAVGPEGDVYVADHQRGDLQRFDSQGQFLAKWSLPDSRPGAGLAHAVDAKGNVYVPLAGTRDVGKYDSQGNLLARIGERGTGDGQFLLPKAVDVDTQGNLYVADGGNHCIQKFDAEGNFLMKWGGMGSGPGKFHSPVGLAVAPDGSIYVSDGNRVQKFRQQ